MISPVQAIRLIKPKHYRREVWNENYLMAVEKPCTSNIQEGIKDSFESGQTSFRHHKATPSRKFRTQLYASFSGAEKRHTNAIRRFPSFGNINSTHLPILHMGNFNIILLEAHKSTAAPNTNRPFVPYLVNFLLADLTLEWSASWGLVRPCHPFL